MAKRQQKSHSTRSRSLRMRVQDAILQSKHLDLREKLHFRSIFPYLNSHGLLPHSYDQTKLVDENATVQQQIDDIITHLPKCGKEDYLREFIECLRESEEGTGSAHLELAKSLEDAYTAKMGGPECQRESDHEEGTRSPESTTDSEQAVEQLEVQYHAGSVTSTTAEHHCEDGTRKSRYRYKHFHGCMCGLLLVLLVALLMVITALGVLSDVPKINQDSSIIRPLFAYGSTRTPLLVVDFGTDPFWIASAEFQVDDCNGAVLITDGEGCLDLPVSINENYDSSFEISYVYFLSGSIVNITVLEEAATNMDLQVWRLNSEAWLQSELGTVIANLGSCDNPRPGADCFFAHGFAGQTIQQMIERADYYFFFVNDFFSDAVQFTYAARQYNHTAIHEQHRLAETAVTKRLSHTIAVSNAFDFQQRKCILLDLSCSGVQMHSIQISGVKRRMDILIIPGGIGIFIILVVILVFSICILRIVWSNLKKRHQSP